MSTILFPYFFRPLLRSNALCAHISTGPCVLSNRNKPRSSGDRGPDRNYQKKMTKKFNKSNPLMKGQKGNGSNEQEPMNTLMKGLKSLESNEFDPGQDKVQDLLSDMLQGSNMDRGRFKQQQEHLQETVHSRDVPKTSPQMKRPINFVSSDSGPRLGIFNSFDATLKAVTPKAPNLTEEDKQRQLEEIRLLQTTSYFQDIMEGRGVPYPRQFPVDNEEYAHTESEVSFKDHVLLDTLIKDFPSKGPVRHFMELVVTGLSMNPEYSVAEKRDIVMWYKEYFEQFTPAELQALPAKSLPELDLKTNKNNPPHSVS